LIDAECAGVCFTINPVTRSDELLISAAWGLGEAVVQGMVVPDNVRVDRAGAVIEYTVGHKEIEVRRAAGSGTETRPVSSERTGAACLSAEQISELSAAARECERLHGRAVDLEWAYRDSRLYMLQCRPVTGHGAPPAQSKR
jgi:pyruvate,water dikinase